MRTRTVQALNPETFCTERTTLKGVIMGAESKIKATLRLGSESYSVSAKEGGTLSQQLVSMKEESMSFLKEFITKHNVPTDVPDDLVEPSSEEEEEVIEKPNVKSKKTKIN